MAARKSLKFPFTAVSSKSERVFSVAGNTFTSKRASLNPEKMEDKVLVGGGQESNTSGEVLDLHVYSAFWMILNIIFVNFFGEKKGNFYESPKPVSVGGWVRYIGLCPKKLFFLPLPFSICFISMTLFAWLCFAEKHLLLFGSISCLLYGP